jgi:hypothetical protein
MEHTLKNKPVASASRSFLERLDPDREHWVLGAMNPAPHPGWRWRTFSGPMRGPLAERWIAARYIEGVEVWLVLGDVGAPVDGHEVPTGAVTASRFVAAVSHQEETFLARAAGNPLTVFKDDGGRYTAVWKLPEPVGQTEAVRLSGRIAAACCFQNLRAWPQLHYIPLPGDIKPSGLRGSVVRMPIHGRAPVEHDAPLFLAVPSQEQVALSSAPPLTEENAFLARKLEESISKFGVAGRVTNVKSGPVVTVCDFEKEHTTKVATVVATADDVAMLMKSKSVIARPDTGRGVVCFDVANTTRKTVFLRDMLASQEWREAAEKVSLPLSIGVGVDGTPRFADLAGMPHLLVAGSTGSGKSVALNAMLLSLLTRYGPTELRLVLIDPKRVELTTYSGVPHLLAPVADTVAKAVAALDWAVVEMEQRYELLAAAGVKNITRFNAKAMAPLPWIVVVIDEYATLMHQAQKKVGDAISRLSAEARAAGIHLILATQHPSAKTITGPIKANIPVRLVFRTAQRESSQAAIGSSDATKLLGMGDGFLWLDGELERIHGAFADDDEVEQFVDARRKLGSPVYALTFESVAPVEMIDDFDDGDELEEATGERPTIRLVEDWLDQRLSGVGAVQSTVVIAEGEARGFNARMTRRAAKSIGVTETPSGKIGVAGNWSL